MTTYTNTTHGALTHLRRNKLATALSLILAGLFNINITEAQTADWATIPGTPDTPPFYLAIAMEALRNAPQVFLLGATVTTAGGVGIATDGDHSDESVTLRAANATGVQALSGIAINFDRGKVDSGSTSTVSANGQRGLHAADGGRIEARNANVILIPKNTANVPLNVSNMTGVIAENGGQIDLTNASISMGGASGSNNTGLIARGAGSRIDFKGGDVSTVAKGSRGAVALDGGQVQLNNVQVATTGSGSHGLLALDDGSRIDGNGVKVDMTATNTSAVRVESGAAVALKNSELTYSNPNNVKSLGMGVVHAESGGSVSVGGAHSTLDVTGAGMYGLFAKGAGSNIDVENTDIVMHGLAGGTVNGLSHGVVVSGGAAASLSDSRLTIKEDVWNGSKGVNVNDAGARFTLDQSEIVSEKAGAHGILAQSQAEVNVTNSSITALKDNTQGVRINGVVQDAGLPPSTLNARNMQIETFGKGESEGLVLSTGAHARLEGGSVTTHGDADLLAGTRAIGIALKPSGDASKPTTLWADGTAVHTFGRMAHGVGVDDGSMAYLNNLSVTTEGQSAHGLYSLVEWPGDHIVAGLFADNVNVRTFGASAAGAMVKQDSVAHGERKATLTLNNASVSTSGSNAPGLNAVNGGVLAATNSVINTTGASAHGAYSLSNGEFTAGVPSVIALENVSTTTSGAKAHAAMAENDARIDADRVTLSASGAGSAALALSGSDFYTPQASVNNGILRNIDGGTISTRGPASLQLTDSSVGGSRLWLDTAASPTAAGNAHIDLSGSVVSGAATTAAGSQSDVTLRDISIWQLTGPSNLSHLRNNASLIDFSAPVGNTFKQLTVNNYHGENGTIALNTYLFDDGSPSDRLVVDGGQASGSTNLQIKNAGGAGALTTGNGIMVVDAVNGGTTQPEAFRLLSQVKAGPYEYTLHRASQDDSNEQAWYLRSTRDVPTDPVNPIIPTDPVNPITPTDPEVPVSPAPVFPQAPNYRAETSLYQGIPAMALHYSRAMVDTLHERVGEERRRATVDPLLYEDERTAGPSLGWGRVIYSNGKDSSASFNHDYSVRAFQVGIDLYHSEDAFGRTNQAGLSLGIGSIDGSVDRTDGKFAGSDGLRAISLGGYWTHYTPTGSYVDSVLQLHRFKAEAKPGDADKLKTRGHGVTASVEVGRPFILDADKEMYIEPQAQVVYSKSNIKNAQDGAAEVRFNDVDSLTGRLGVRVDKDWFREDDKGELQRINAWVRPSVWHEFKGQPKTEFSSAAGYVPFTNDMRGTWGELNLGVDYQINDRTSVTGSVGYQKAFEGDSRSYEGILGIKVKF
ncbi:outer membrane autotransporter barrel domain-containing protein [Pseudomonas sp. GM78]|uniref:autotransporter outer membrane beta-barrel domain-containing protein n=1 Tax=Pseudomonas sp. GM78 TaxID=1144337 RepID=UPI0002706A68|nr:autotransporter outer membrane beta-barrel domain-containing protein [Pseudomonas sp. GM78]EJN25955.1 outer membrane autotransporter barrel domain-containing protein [Pseudomonas sp. GM78]